MAAVDHNRAQEQGQQDTTTAVSTALTVMSIVVVGLRLFSRGYVIRNIGKDDIAMFVALFFTVVYLIEIYVLRANGMGFSGAELSLHEMTVQIQTTLAVEITYYIIVFCIKLSLVLFYLRIAVHHVFELLCRITVAILSMFVFICIIVCLVQCVPLHKFWDLTGLVQGHCINTTALFYSTSTFNIMTDIWILALPVNTLLKIQRPTREKLALLFVFLLGIFSCIASIVRLKFIRTYTESEDPFYDSVPINLWSMIEVNIGILCASIPALKPLLSKSQRERTRHVNGAQYGYHSKDISGSVRLGNINGGGSGASDAIGSRCTPGDVDKADPFVDIQVKKTGSKKSIDERSAGSQEEILGTPHSVEAAHFR